MLSKVANAKNKAPAEILITVEQLLREAKGKKLEIIPPPPIKISELQKLADYQRSKRQSFEDNITKNRMDIDNWIKYAEWEESQREIQRARFIFERALDVDHQNIHLWLNYGEMEMRDRQVDNARYVWDRAVTIEPLADALWYKYTDMEEKSGNVESARLVFERWMESQPEEDAWLKYIQFELRYKEFQRARYIYSRFILVEPEAKNWVKYAKLEENHRFISEVRKIFGRAAVKLKVHYEQEIRANPVNYDAWFDYIEIVEGEGNIDMVRYTYERAIANIPPVTEKKYWKRYICLWIYYAIFEELHCIDVERTRQVYKACIEVLPHKLFTFAKIWLLYAKFEIRQRNINRAREILNTSLDMCPKNKLFKGYVALELKLDEPIRCSILYERYLEFHPIMGPLGTLEL